MKYAFKDTAHKRIYSEAEMLIESRKFKEAITPLNKLKNELEKAGDPQPSLISLKALIVRLEGLTDSSNSQDPIVQNEVSCKLVVPNKDKRSTSKRVNLDGDYSPSVKKLRSTRRK